MKLIATVLAVQTLVICTSFQSAIPCSIEYVYGSSISSQRTVYVWNTKDNNGMYPSSPLCLDVNYNVIMRKCQDGSWYPKYVDNCYNFECPIQFLGFNQDECYYQFASEDVCPDLHSILARLQHGSHFNATAPYTSVSCPYDVREFLNASLTSANRISVLFSFVKKLHLTVNFPEVLADGDDKKAICCYSGKVDLKLKINRKIVGLKKLYQSAFSDGLSKNYTVFELDIADDPMEYWCHIHEIGQVRPITTQRVLAYKKKLGNEYALRVAVQGSNGLNLTKKLCQTCRLMEVSSFATRLAEYVLHFTAEAADDVTTQLSTLRADLEARAEGFQTVEIISFRSSEFCLPLNGTWSLTPIGSMALPLVVCLDSNGNPIGRKCSGSFLYGAEWEEEKPCSEKAQLPEITKSLSNVISRGNIDFTALSNLVGTLHNFTSVDVALAADGFKRAQANSSTDFLKAISKIMGLNRKVLETSQKYYNAMDKILDKIDEVLIENPVKPVMEENLSVITMRPFKDEVVGTAFYKHNRVRQILKNQTLQDLPLENLEAVVIAPHDLLEALTRNLSREKKEDFQVVITAFKNDDLFSGAKGASGRIINVAIPGFRTYWFAPTETFLRPMAPTREIDYGFWDYERGIFNTERIHSGFAHSPNFPIVDTSYQSRTRSIGLSNPHLIMTLVMKLIFLWHFFECLI